MSATRDISWGANCDGCETRLDAGQAARALAATKGDALFCGACRDEQRYEARVAELEECVRRVFRDRRESDKVLLECVRVMPDLVHTAALRQNQENEEAPS